MRRVEIGYPLSIRGHLGYCDLNISLFYCYNVISQISEEIQTFFQKRTSKMAAISQPINANSAIITKKSPVAIAQSIQRLWRSVV